MSRELRVGSPISLSMLVLLGLVLTSVMVHAQNDESGFISIDCGIVEGSSYADDVTGINYISDAEFRDSGEIDDISIVYNAPGLDKRFTTLTYFPQNSRNCYTLRPTQGKGNRYLIRASFMYGNYDSLGQLPEFDIHLGPDYWDTVKLDSWDQEKWMEIIHVPSSDYIHVCLVKTAHGTPFISALELRLLPSNMYKETNSGSLSLHSRCHYDTKYATVRYKADKYDRIWLASALPDSSTSLNTSDEVVTYINPFDPPLEVMSNALMPSNPDSSLLIQWNCANTTYKFFLYLYIAEIELLKRNQTRIFDIYLNEKLILGAYSPPYLTADTLYSKNPMTVEPKNAIKLTKTDDSSHPPIISAFEIYILKKLQQRHTDDQDAAAILSIKSTYSITKNWQGDPCAPREFVWEGLRCSYNNTGLPRIIYLNLSANELNGEIDPQLAALTMIEILDFSNNKLTGTVPAFLSGLKFLKVLYLKGNNFIGPVPEELLAKSKDGSLSMSFDGESTVHIGSSCGTNRCKNIKESKIIAPVVAAVGFILIIVTILTIKWIIKKRKAHDNENTRNGLEPKKQRLTYSDVMSITDNFKVIIGKGGFGIVYHGYINDLQVAVKMLSESSLQGDKQFQAEACLLMTVHHKNLTSLVGYCDEDNHKGIIYEYMAEGNLERRLFDTSLSVLSWEERLQIGCDVAHGLEYLHHGCKPPIVHRDVKCTNILLSGTGQAKLADFGLSKSFSTDGCTHISTEVAGTPGYLDPDYYTSRRLTEKSDVYSFGILLLVMITGQPAIIKYENDNILINRWVNLRLAGAELKNIVDPRLQGNFDINSAWKVVELAMTCIVEITSERPTMNQVVKELSDCLVIKRACQETKPKELTGLNSLNLEDAYGPNPR